MDKKFDASYANAKKQFKNMHDDAKKVSEEALGPVQERVNREVAEGIKPDFSLYNLVLSTVSFKDCATSRDSNQRVYEGLYPHIRRLNHQNKELRKILEKYELEEKDAKYLEALSTSIDTDPFDMSKDILNKIKEAAKARSKAGALFYNKGIV